MPAVPPTQDQLTAEYAALIPNLADLARNLVRDLDPQVCTMFLRACSHSNNRNIFQNDLEFLRIRSFKHEIMVAASKFYTPPCLLDVAC